MRQKQHLQENIINYIWHIKFETKLLASPSKCSIMSPLISILGSKNEAYLRDGSDGSDVAFSKSWRPMAEKSLANGGKYLHILITSWLQSDESEKSWKIFHCSTSCIIIFESISSGECLGKYMEALWSTDKCKEIHHKSFSHLIVYAFLDTFGGCSEFHLTACHERDWHQINMSFNLKEKKMESHLTKPDIISFWPSSSSALSFASTPSQDPQDHKSTSNTIKSPLVRILPMCPSSSRNMPKTPALLGTQNHSDQLVVKITSITLNLFTLDMTEGCLQDVTSNTTIADHQVFPTWFPETSGKRLCLA